MKLILLSGGSGKRLWPLSNDQRSKQFIKILRNEEKLESMVQRVWRQLETIDLVKDTFIATGNSQRSILKAQLKIEDTQIITEPSRRDTFPAIALASTYLYSEVSAEENEMVIVLPVDPYVDVTFFKKVMELEDLLNETDATLGLLGINPTLPSEKYGYIVPESNSSTKVEYFQEKPTRAIAKSLIDNGAVWNAGVFGFKLSTMLNLLREQGITTDYKELTENYSSLPKNSFDYEFSERQEDIAFLRYEGYWKDLGTWNTLTEEMDTRSVGYTTEMLDVNNTHVINETSLPISVIGVKDLVIAAGPEGILVSTKEESPRVKELSDEFFNSVRFIEEDWGVRHTLVENELSRVTQYQIINGKSLTLTLNKNQNLVRLSGIGKLINENNIYHILGEKDLKFIIVTEEI